MDRERIVRRTSYECFKELVRNQVLPTMRREIYEWLFEHGPATRNEIAREIHMIPNNCSTRLKEMFDMGIVCEVGEDKCKVTGRQVILYDVTDSMPHSRGANGKRSKPEYFFVASCDDCLPLQDDADEEPNMCWMDPKVSQAKEGCQPDNCPLIERDFVVRAERRRR